MEDGLSLYSITSLLIDRQGYLWVGTVDGLNRFDGYAFTIFRERAGDPGSLPSGHVNKGALFEDRDGYLWIGTQRGLSRRDPATGKFVRYVHDPDEPNSLSHDNVLSLAQSDDGFVWIGTENGLNRMDPKSGKIDRYLHDATDTTPGRGHFVNALVDDGRGFMWVGTWGRGLFRLEHASGEWTRFTHDDGNHTSIASNEVVSLGLGTNGDLWIGTWGSGIDRMELQQPGVFDHLSPLSNAYVMEIFTEPGAVWIGTYGGGLHRLELVSGTFDRFGFVESDPQSIPNDQVAAVRRDRSGNLWVGTWDGLCKSPVRKAFQLLTHRDDGGGLSHQRVGSIIVDPIDQNVLWVGTLGGGLNRVSYGTPGKAEVRHYPDATREGNSEVSAVLRDASGRLWIGSHGGGLAALDAEGRVVRRFRHDPGDSTSLQSDYIYDLFEDSRGSLWVGTSTAGLCRLDNETEGFHCIPSLSHRAIWTMHEDAAGTLWIGTFGGGLNAIDPQRRHIRHFRAASDDPPALGADRIASITNDHDGNLWVGTIGGGLSRFHPETERFETYTVEDGLPHDNVACILPDDHGNLWLSTFKGLSKFEITTARFTNYRAADGFLSDVFYSDACARNARGEMFFGSYDGVVTFHPDSIRGNPVPPPVVITGIDLFNRPLPLDSLVSSAEPITLPHDQNYVSFHFAALDFTSPLYNSYSYRLDRLDADWVTARNGRNAHYPRLPPGKYVFRVMGANADGAWNPAETSIAFVIRPPYWRTWWFYLLVAALVTAALAAAHRYRVRHLLQVERTRRRIADDLHDDIGSKIGSIAVRLDMMTRSTDLSPTGRHQLDDVLATTRQLASNLRDTVWIVHADHDRLHDLVERMRDVARQLLQGHAFSFHAPDFLHREPIDMKVRRQVYLIYKEALHNAVRHAGASQIDIEVEYAESLLSVSVIDDGSGFDPDAVRKGRGFRTMHDRAVEIGGKLSLESAPGRGTAIRLSVRIT